MSQRPVPTPTSDSAPFWEGCRAGKIRLQRCETCRHLQFYPRRYCTSCMSDRLVWEDASGNGVVYSYSTVHRALSPAFKGEVPYTVAVVELTEGPRMMTQLVECDEHEVVVGMPVEATFLRLSDEIALPVFRPQEVRG